MGVLLAIAATGCGDAGPNAPDDLPVATSTPAGSVEPVNTASSGDDLPVAASTPAGSVKPVNTASSGDGIWVLDLVDGRPLIEERVVTLRIIGNGLDGFDGCNRYGGVFEDETPVAGADGVFSRPPFARTEKGCFFIDHANPNVIMDQADAYLSALVHEERDTALRTIGWRYWTVRAQPGWYSSVRRRSQEDPSTCAAPRGVSLRTTTWTMTNV